MTPNGRALANEVPKVERLVGAHEIRYGKEPEVHTLMASSPSPC